MIRKEIPVERQPQIVALTADAFKENAQKCLDCGMDKVLTKPYVNK
jgi:CheY-like chemotaxis protein